MRRLRLAALLVAPLLGAAAEGRAADLRIPPLPGGAAGGGGSAWEEEAGLGLAGDAVATSPRRPARRVTGDLGYVGSDFGLGKPAFYGLGTRPDWGRSSAD